MGHIRKIVVALALIAGLIPAFAQAPPPVPALPDTERRTSYNISASTCACSVGFQLYGDSTDYQNWVEVFINGTLVNYNDPVLGWTITSPTGPLATIPRPITNAVLTFTNTQTGTIQIVGARHPRRSSQFSENRGVAARDLNQVVTDIIAMVREAWDKINDVTGRGIFAPPGETMKTLPPAAQRAGMDAVFDSNGNLIPSASVPAGGIAGGSNITLTGSNPTLINLSQGAANTFKGSLNGSTTTDLALVACNTLYGVTNYVLGTGWSCNFQAVLPSRAVAATLNLSGFTAIHTLGYATPGDGGEATFLKISSSTAFQDAYISGLPTITTAGSGLANATYTGVALGGGSGVGCSGSAVVSGGVLASIAIVVPCVGYKAGDVLTIQTSFIGGTGTSPTLTVPAVSTPQASFTDSASDHWQFVAGEAGRANILQFGAKGDWNGADASATNNSPAAWSAAAWASAQVGTSVAQVYGNQVFWPRGAYMTCGAWNGTIYDLPIPQGVRFTGAGVGATTHVECAADSSANHYYELCDSNSHFGQYGCKVEDFTTYLGQVTGGTANIAAIYSNSGQQFPLAERMELQSGLRGCVFYEIGKGGAANANFNNIDCEQLSTTTNDGFRFNSTGTLITVRDSVFGAGGGTATHNAIDLLAGRLIADGIEIEEATTGINIASTSAGDLSSIRNVNITNGCVNGITISTSNPNNTVLVEQIVGGSCSNKLVLNGHTSGTSVNAGSINAQMGFNP